MDSFVPSLDFRRHLCTFATGRPSTESFRDILLVVGVTLAHLAIFQLKKNARSEYLAVRLSCAVGAFNGHDMSCLDAQTCFVAVSWTVKFVRVIAIPEWMPLIGREVDAIDRGLCGHSNIAQQSILPDNLRQRDICNVGQI